MTSTIRGPKSRPFNWDHLLPHGEFRDQILRTAAFLSERFSGHHARIGLWGECTEGYLAAFLAILRAGHTAVPLDPRLGSHELTDIVHSAKIAGLLVSRDFPIAYSAALGNTKIYPLSPYLRSKTCGGQDSGPPVADGADAAVMLCGSRCDRSTRMITFALPSLIRHAQVVCSHLNVTAEDAWLMSVPLHCVAGLVIPFRCLVSGASLRMCTARDPDEINRLIDTGRVSIVSATPDMFDKMLRRHGTHPYLGNLRAIFISGIVPELQLLRCPQACMVYGVAEAGSMVSCSRPGCTAEEHLSAGPVLPGMGVRIIGSDGKDVRRGERGRILVRGLDASGEGQRAGWVQTEDYGYLDGHGYLHPEPHQDDAAGSGENSVCTVEIQTLLERHPRVQRVIVVSMEDKEWGQVPAALVVLTPGRPMEKTHLFQFLEGKLARYKFPKKIIFADALPLLSGGKPDLAAIRKLLKG
ncbi:MAG TPA: class I adenylate-forming enzyme family protein [bacterium]